MGNNRLVFTIQMDDDVECVTTRRSKAKNKTRERERERGGALTRHTFRSIDGPTYGGLIIYSIAINLIAHHFLITNRLMTHDPNRSTSIGLRVGMRHRLERSPFAINFADFIPIILFSCGLAIIIFFTKPRIIISL